MRIRWLVPLLLLPLAQATAALASEREAKPPAPPATRSDVVAGTATDRQAVELLRQSLQAAGGTATADEEVQEGNAYPVLAADLDGDGDDEVILHQYLYSDPGPSPYPPFPSFRYQVVDDRGVLWGFGGKTSFAIGLLPGDFAPTPGTEVLSLSYSYQGFPSSPTLDLAMLGGRGILWQSSLAEGWFEVNGLVEADGDELTELALSTWNGSGDLSIHTLDGDRGSNISVTRPSLAPTNLAYEGFVTDGSASAPDESVFLVRLAPAVSYVERYRLSDGQLTLRDVAVSDVRSLYQGPDYTGDGRRDAFARTALGDYGVFDGSTMRLVWSKPDDDDPLHGRSLFPYPAGDVNGDGGQELCLITETFHFSSNGQPGRGSAGATCDAGQTGTQIWEFSLEATGEMVWPETRVGSDLDGDGLPDPIVYVSADDCEITDGSGYCTPISEKIAAISGKDARPLWPADTDPGLAWFVTESDLDGVPGDDAVEPWWWGSGSPDGATGVTPGDAEPNARFSVLNGLRLRRSWEGIVDTRDLPGDIGWGLDADVNGDGDRDAVFTAVGYEIRGNNSRLHSFVQAMETDGSKLWNFEL